MSSIPCPFCDYVVSPQQFTTCKMGHVYCDECALVYMAGGSDESPYPEDDSSVFCPMCTQPPQEYLCPITHELMESPVVAQDGFTYEKSAIEDWMRHRKSSPKTNEPIEAIFIPNFNIKTLIVEWRLRHCGSAT